MKKILILAACAACAVYGYAQEFEDAKTAVANMRVGWNVGNRLDSNSGDVENMWIEAWTSREPQDYETAWGQPQITRELIHMFKEAGFNAIRVPVTWYPHMGKVDINVIKDSNGDYKGVWNQNTWTSFKVDAAWMARVKEVVDYVIEEDMYCILNVHHDTGEATTAWLRADANKYSQQKKRYEALWTQIATEFKDYGEHLLFEGYNEMLDPFGSWCFASFAGPNNYNYNYASSAYKGINSFAQSFVDAVRSTGGNNATRNLVICTYGACSGEGNWNSHLKDPLNELVIPTDAVAGHIIAEVHSYPAPKNLSEAKSAVDELVSVVKTNLCNKGVPVIIGEWGMTSPETTSGRPKLYCDYARYLIEQTKKSGIATFMWMTLADGDDCKVPKWTKADIKDAIIKGYYGEEGYNGRENPIAGIEEEDGPVYNLQGMKAAEPLTPGLYVRNGKKFIVR